MRGLFRTWDPDQELWLPRVPKVWDGYGWSRAVADYTTARVSPYAPYLADGSVWTRSVTDMPLHSETSDLAAWMAANVNYGAGFGPTALNTSQNGTHPIQVHVIDSRLSSNKAYITGTFPTGFATSLLSGWVPWPEYDLVLQAGQDSSVCVIDLGTGIIREYYFVAKVSGTKNRYTSTTGGYSIAPRDLAGWGEVNYATHLTEGSSAVVRMHNHFGFVGILEAFEGRVNHALAFTCSNMAVPNSTSEAIRADGTRYQHTGVSWPALSGDGDIIDDYAPVHGQWGRLPQGIDLTKYRPYTRLLIQAAQDYGLVATDTNNFVHSFNAEHGGQWKALHGGVDPYTATTGELWKKYSRLADEAGYSYDQPFNVSDFPWHLTEWAPRNWGEPE